MKEQLLVLIEEAELLRAQALTENMDGIINVALHDAINDLYWAYRYLVKYD